jgi:hypothetical protein
VDIKYGISDTLMCLKFSEFLFDHSQIYSSKSLISEEEKCFSFIIPYLMHSNIANIKMKDLVQFFRVEYLIYDVEKRNGIIFNLPDIIQSGMIGLCAIASSSKQVNSLLKSSIELLKLQINTKERKSYNYESKSDAISFDEIAEILRTYLKKFNEIK